MKKALTALVVLIAAAAFFWWWFKPENVVKRRTLSLLELIEVSEGISDIARSARGPRVGEYLASTVHLKSPENIEDEASGSFPRDELAGIYSAVAKYCRVIEVGKPKIDSIMIEGDRAIVRLRVDVVVELPDRRPVDGIQEVNFTWERDAQKWLLKQAGWSQLPRY